MRILILIAFCFTQFTTLWSQNANDVIGLWLTKEGKAYVKIEVLNGKYVGTITYLKDPLNEETGKPKVDKNNPDKNHQNDPIIGLKILRNLKFDEGEWTDGQVYDPENGKEYSCTVSLKDRNTLEMRGYIGFSMFGRTEVWKRIK